MIAVTELHGEHAWRYLMESVTDGQGDLREADAITQGPGSERPGLGRNDRLGS